MSKEKKICCIYLLYNNEGFGYIGKSKDLIERLRKHRDGVGSIRGCMSRNLGEFQYEILEEVKPEDLYDFERYYYDMYFDMFEKMLINRNKPLRTRREYFEENREELKKKSKAIITCVCGRKYTKTNKSKHFKSPIHKNLLLKKVE